MAKPGSPAKWPLKWWALDLQFTTVKLRYNGLGYNRYSVGADFSGPG